ncbi:hypothetical protein VPNG_05605 [Cytospora leucostoma]|uniref:MARVEL domain-containing protein n=1 Tax=Cytospora leucostoma TaxID=1230097 RepID=A0A423X6T8_9PEZI|nr:hypothetical protein VPNG_05605 [Cytospora leucostoma]
MAGSGIALKILQWFNRGVLFCCSALILGLTSYYLAAFADHDTHIPVNLRAVEGISGGGVVYAAIGVLLVCCLAGFAFTSFLAIFLDICFVGAYIYVATVYKDGASTCTGANVKNVFGTGNASADVSVKSDGKVPLPSNKTACRMESACLAVAIVAAVWFLVSALTEVLLARHRRKEKRFGPSPRNNYTSGYGTRKRGLFSRRPQPAAGTPYGDSVLPTHTTPDQVRESYATETTRVGDAPAATYGKY